MLAHLLVTRFYPATPIRHYALNNIEQHGLLDPFLTAFQSSHATPIEHDYPYLSPNLDSQGSNWDLKNQKFQLAEYFTSGLTL